MNNIKQLQIALNYTFNDVSLLKRALTHKSYSKMNYERLEFVGDALLDYTIALLLYKSYPDLPEGQLSKIRASLVNQDTLHELAANINLGDYLLLGDGEEKSGGRSRVSILADTLEAIFAAISIDSDITQAENVIKHLYTNLLLNNDLLVNKDYKSILQEYLQAHKISLPQYSVIELLGPDHNSIFNVECYIVDLNLKAIAKGKTKKEASQAAAMQALNIIKEGNISES